MPQGARRSHRAVLERKALWLSTWTVPKAKYRRKFNAGFTEQDFTASIVLQANDAFRFKPATRVENACSTGTAAVREAIKTVEAQRAKSLFECAISRVYADSAVSGLSLEQALACKTGCPLLARSLWARFRQPRRQSFFGQAIGIPHSNRL